MKLILSYFTLAIVLISSVSCMKWDTNTDIFVHPERGFISTQPAENWQHGLLAGNGTTGAIIRGNPYNEIITLSHESLYLPYEKTEEYMEMASHLQEIQNLCLAAKFVEAADMVTKIREEQSYFDIRDPFIAAFNLKIQQPEDSIIRYQRSVDFMTAEASVSLESQQNSFQRSTFASRSDDVIVVRLKGRKKLSAKFFFEGLIPENDNEKKIVTEGIKSKQQGVKDGLLYFQTLFAHTNSFNPNMGYEGVGKIVTKGGSCNESENGMAVVDADEILLVIKIRPILKTDTELTNFKEMATAINNINPDYKELLESHVSIHGELMSRVSLSLDAPEANRTMPSEELIRLTEKEENPLAMIERAFDAGRYNIICSTGSNPPNLQGIWSATWLANWSGSFTTNGNLQCAVAFQLMGNTPELMEAYFRYYDNRWDEFRENARLFKGTRGFHVPAQLTVGPRSTNFTSRHPHCYWHSGAAWACQFYYDYYQYTGDLKFLEERAYPIMKEAAEFYEDFLIKTEENGKLAFVAFGLVQLGLASAHIGNINLTQEIINFLAKGYWTTGMGSFHNRNDLFNTDISGGFPYLCASSLVYADPGYIRFFPARPEQWESGSVKGLLLRGGITVKELIWNEENAKAVLVSKTEQSITIENSMGIKKEYDLLPGVETGIEIE